MKPPKAKSSCQPFTNITENNSKVFNRLKEKPTLMRVKTINAFSQLSTWHDIIS